LNHCERFSWEVSQSLGVCLTEAASGADTSKVSELPNLSTSFGVFQINSKEWCRKGRRGGECGIRCEGNRPVDIAKLLVSFNQRTFVCRLPQRRHQRWHKVCESDLQPEWFQVLERLGEAMQKPPTARRFKMSVWIEIYYCLSSSFSMILLNWRSICFALNFFLVILCNKIIEIDGGWDVDCVTWRLVGQQERFLVSSIWEVVLMKLGNAQEVSLAS
jgi:hypothetical protein